MNTDNVIWIAIASGGFGLLVALLHAIKGLGRQDNEQVRAIAKTIQKGASGFLKREYVALSLLGIPIAFGLTYLGQWIANGFIAGALGAVLAGQLAASASLKSNVKTLEASNSGLAKALKTAFNGGSAAGMAASGLALLLVAGYYLLAIRSGLEESAFPALLGLGLGAAFAGLFLRIAGGLYANAAQFGLTEANHQTLDILQEDIRNPAIIASNVAANVGEAVGLTSDLYESHTLALVAAMLLADHAFGHGNPWILFPLLVDSVSLLAFFIGHYFVRVGHRKRTLAALYRGLLATLLLAGGGYYFVSQWFLTLPGTEIGLQHIQVVGTTVVGIVLAGAVLMIAEYQTQASYRPVKGIAAAAVEGQEANLLAGLSLGQKSVVTPLLLACAVLTGAYYFGGGLDANPWGGLYSVALATLASLALGSSAVALNAYAGIVSNASSIAEMAGLYSLKYEITNPLNRSGYTAKAVARSYANLTAGLAALTLFAEFASGFGEASKLSLSEPKVLFGLLLGGLTVHWLSARLLGAVAKGLVKMKAEVVRQIRDIPGLADGLAAPQYERCLEIAARSAIRQSLMPVLVLLAVPVAIGFGAGSCALAGFLIGGIAVGLLQALASTVSGSALSNARLYIENGRFGGNRSSAHEAALQGEAIGNPLKVVVGPAVASLGKLSAVTALLIVPLLS